MDILHKNVNRYCAETVYFDNLPFHKITSLLWYNILRNTIANDIEALTGVISHLKMTQRFDLLYNVIKICNITSIEKYGSLETHKEIKNLLSDIQNNNLNISIDTFKSLLENILKNEIKDILNKEISSPGIENIKKIFNLSYKEVFIIITIFIMFKDDNLVNLINTKYLSECLKVIGIATNLSDDIIKKYLSKNSKLIRLKLVDFYRYDMFPVHIDDEIEYILSEIDDFETLEKDYIRHEHSNFAVNSYSIEKIDIDILSTIIKSNKKCNILFYGEPGTGKTEFSKSIINYCGKRALFINQNDKESLFSKKVALEGSLSIADKNDTIVVDEADNLLAPRIKDTSIRKETYSMFSMKEYINDFMERSDKQIIWIVNEISHIDKSTLRRFDYSIQFKPFSKKEREIAIKMAANKTKIENILSKSELIHFAKKYPLSMGPISFAFNTLKIIMSVKKRSKKTILKYLDRILYNHTKLIEKIEVSNKQFEPKKHFDPSILNANQDLNLLIKKLKRYTTSNKIKIEGINLLFYGLPGTGKTEFSKYIAHKLNKELIVKRASDIISMWVGGTENNINDIFREAEKEDAILLLDEADSFFTDRKNAFRSWEITRTNELLTQMENHKIIFIACTNFLESLDSASLRRFHWKVNFKPLDNTGKIKLYNLYFSNSLGPISKKQKEKLIKLENLTPGDFKAVWKRTIFLEDKDVSHERIINELENEIRIKNIKIPNKIGLI